MFTKNYKINIKLDIVADVVHNIFYVTFNLYFTFLLDLYQTFTFVFIKWWGGE